MVLIGAHLVDNYDCSHILCTENEHTNRNASEVLNPTHISTGECVGKQGIEVSVQELGNRLVAVGVELPWSSSTDRELHVVYSRQDGAEFGPAS